MSLGSGATGFLSSVAAFAVLSDAAAGSGLSAEADGAASAGLLAAGTDSEP